MRGIRRKLDKIFVPAAMLIRKNLVQRRLRLQVEVLRASAAHVDDAVFLRRPDQRRRLDHVLHRVQKNRLAKKLRNDEVHPDGAVAGARGINRHVQPVRRDQHRFLGMRRHLGEDPAEFPMKLGGGHRPFALDPANGLQDHLIRCDERAVLADVSIVNPRDSHLRQFVVVRRPMSLRDRTVERTMQIVIQVRASGDDPIDEPGLHQIDEDALHADRRHRSADGHADRGACFQHARIKLTRFSKPSPVKPAAAVAMIHEVGDVLVALEADRLNLPPGEKLLLSRRTLSRRA